MDSEPRKMGRLCAANVKEEFNLGGVIWAIIVILFIIWLLGLLAFHLGSLIHIILVVVVILIIVNLLTGRGFRV
jgi:hypothetical protein